MRMTTEKWKFEKAALGLDFGSVTLTLFIKQGRLRYTVNREESCIPSEEPSHHDDFSAKEETGNISYN